MPLFCAGDRKQHSIKHVYKNCKPRWQNIELQLHSAGAQSLAGNKLAQNFANPYIKYFDDVIDKI